MSSWHEELEKNKNICTHIACHLFWKYIHRQLGAVMALQSSVQLTSVDNNQNLHSLQRNTIRPILTCQL